MRSYGLLEQFQEGLWNISTLQFHMQASNSERVKWKKVDVVSRMTFGAITALYVSHAWYPFLSKRIVDYIQKGLIVWLSAFATSLLLRGLNHRVQLQEDERKEEIGRSANLNSPAFCTPLLNVSRPITVNNPLFSPIEVEEESWEEDVYSDESIDCSSDFENDSEESGFSPGWNKRARWKSRVCRNLLSEFEASLETVS